MPDPNPNCLLRGPIIVVHVWSSLDGKLTTIFSGFDKHQPYSQSICKFCVGMFWSLFGLHSSRPVVNVVHRCAQFVGQVQSCWRSAVEAWKKKVTLPYLWGLCIRLLTGLQAIQMSASYSSHWFIMIGNLGEIYTMKTCLWRFQWDGGGTWVEAGPKVTWFVQKFVGKNSTLNVVQNVESIEVS